MRFSTKLVVLLSGLVVASGAAQAYLYGMASRRLLEEQIVGRLESRASGIMNNLDRYLYERYNEVGALASEPLFASAAPAPGQVAALLSAHLRWHREFESAAYYGKDRALIADTAPGEVDSHTDLEKVWAQVANGADYTISVWSPPPVAAPGLLLAYAVRDGRGAVRGLIVSRLPQGIIDTLVGGAAGLREMEKDLRIDLVDRDGRTLYSNAGERRQLPDRGDDWGLIEPKIRAGEQAGHIRRPDPVGTGGEELLFFTRDRGFREYFGTGWTLSLRIQSAVAFAPATALRNRLDGVLLIFSGILLAVVFVAVRSFTRPIADLTRTAEQIGTGNLEARVTIGAGGELANFGRTFNRMADELQESRAEMAAINRELEGLVDERTAELLRTNVLLHAELSERVKTQEALAANERLLRLNADIGEALTRGQALGATLQECAGILVRSLDATFARLWTLGGEPGVLELAASAGEHTRLDGEHSRKVFGELKIGIIAQTQRPIVTNEVVGDPAITDQEWARREGMRAFAGHPLVVDGRTLGVMALFSRRALDSFTLAALGTVADKIAAFIGRRTAEEALRASERRYRELFESSLDGVFVTDGAGLFTSINPAGARIFGHENPSQMFGRPAPGYWREAADHERFIERLRREKFLSAYPARAKRADGTFLELEVSVRILEGEDGTFQGTEGVMRDVTRRVRDEAERELLIAELQEAAANIRTLSGLLPICAGCKKIRDEHGGWNQIESYVSSHTEAVFSHGLCPDCQKVYFPGFGGSGQPGKT